MKLTNEQIESWSDKVTVLATTFAVAMYVYEVPTEILKVIAKLILFTIEQKETRVSEQEASLKMAAFIKDELKKVEIYDPTRN